jgi:hypothetical protein
MRTLVAAIIAGTSALALSTIATVTQAEESSSQPGSVLTDAQMDNMTAGDCCNASGKTPGGQTNSHKSQNPND